MKPRNQLTFMVTAGVLGVIAVAGCGGSKSTASQSAAAYDAARAKGETASPAAPMDHASMGHTTPTSPGTRPGQGSGMAGMDHSSMAMPSGQRPSPGRGMAMDHSRMPGMSHGRAARMQHGSSAMDHSRPAQPAASPTMGHTDHSAMAGRPGAGAMAGMDHPHTTGTSNMPATQHGTMQHGAMTSPLLEPPARTAADAAPARTLQPDPLDRPAPTALEDATRAAALATEMAGGHAMSHGTYRQIDAGRDSGTTAPAGMPPGHQHQPSRPQSQPSPDPHLHHQPSAPASPSPRPSPTPKESNE
jgi:hypothetical protein